MFSVLYWKTCVFVTKVTRWWNREITTFFREIYSPHHIDRGSSMGLLCDITHCHMITIMWYALKWFFLCYTEWHWWSAKVRTKVIEVKYFLDTVCRPLFYILFQTLTQLCHGCSFIFLGWIYTFKKHFCHSNVNPDSYTEGYFVTLELINSLNLIVCNTNISGSKEG